MSSDPETGESRPGDAWLAGTARTEITPTESMWMAGFGARDRPSEGVHQSLHAKALALEDCEDNRTVIASVEVLVEYSLRLKEELDGPVWVAGYSNDAFTYVPTEQAIYEGGYEADHVVENTTLPGPWKPDIEDRIVSKTRALVDRVHTPPPR